MAVYWITESLPIAVTAILPVVLFPLLGVLPVKDVCRNYMKVRVHGQTLVHLLLTEYQTYFELETIDTMVYVRTHDLSGNTIYLDSSIVYIPDSSVNNGMCWFAQYYYVQ